MTSIYVGGGIVLALIIFLTAARLEKVASATGSALTLKVGSYEVSTSNVLVGLAIVALIAMGGIPGYLLYLSFSPDDHAMTLQVRFSGRPRGPISVVHDDGGNFQSLATLRVYRSRDSQVFLLQNADKESVPVAIWYDRANGRPMASVDNGPDQPANDFNGVSGWLGPVTFGQTVVAARPTSAPNPTNVTQDVPVSLHALADPPRVRQAATSIAQPPGT